MPSLTQCEFFLIRYVPDVVKGEFTNIGVLLREAGADATARVRFTRDWTRVRCMDAAADIGLLEALEGEIAERVRMAATDPKPLLTVLEDSLSNSIQISEPRACLAENVTAELDHLMELHVEPLRAPQQDRRRTGRGAIVAAMRTEFERAGVWPLMRKRIAAAAYTHPGDPMRLDCGYRPNTGVPGELVRGAGNGMIRIFQAVSLAGDAEAAKVLAWSAPRLREGVLRVEGATLELSAVVEPLRAVAAAQSHMHTRDEDDLEINAFDDDASNRYRFAVNTMEEQQIRVLTTADLARAAAKAREELKI